MEKIDMKFLDFNQVFNKNKQLNILKKYGTKCSATDFAILLGAAITSDNIVASDDNFTCRWWTRTSYEAKVVNVDYNGYETETYLEYHISGIRPSFDNTKEEISFEKQVKNKYNVLEVEYGEYPQTAVSSFLASELEEAFQNSKLKKTGKIYFENLDKLGIFIKMFIPDNIIEYEYQGEKYVRIRSNPYRAGDRLSNGRTLEASKVYWIKVEPITWLIDEESNIVLCKKAICSGVGFHDPFLNFNNNFQTSDMKKFIDKCLSEDIIPSQSKIKKNVILKNNKNIYSLNYDILSEEDIIQGMIESNVPVFLHGKSSVGKSARIKQLDPDSTIVYLRNATPESLNGKTVYNESTGEMLDVKPTWLKKLEIKCVAEPKKLHIVFFDEITNALPSIQGMAFNIILDREVNGKWSLPKNARIVAAGNEMSESLAANHLAEPLFNRFAHVYIKTSVNDWLKWAKKNKIHPLIYTTIAFKRDFVLRSEYNGNTPNADPRKWEMASKILYETGEIEMLRSLIGEKLTDDLKSICDEKVITLDSVLNNQYTKEDLQDESLDKCITTIGLTMVDSENVTKVKEFVSLLGQEYINLFNEYWNNITEEKETINDKKIRQI